MLPLASLRVTFYFWSACTSEEGARGMDTSCDATLASLVIKRSHSSESTYLRGEMYPQLSILQHCTDGDWPLLETHGNKMDAGGFLGANVRGRSFVGGFECTVLQRNLKQWLGRPRTYVCECYRKAAKVCSTATVLRNNVLNVSHITFLDGRVHFFSDNFSWNSCIHSNNSTTR